MAKKWPKQARYNAPVTFYLAAQTPSKSADVAARLAPTDREMMANAVIEWSPVSWRVLQRGGRDESMRCGDGHCNGVAVGEECTVQLDNQGLSDINGVMSSALDVRRVCVAAGAESKNRCPPERRGSGGGDSFSHRLSSSGLL